MTSSTVKMCLVKYQKHAHILHTTRDLGQCLGYMLKTEVGDSFVY